MADSTRSLNDLLKNLPLSRRNFIGRITAGTFVAPAISSATIATVLGAGRGLAEASGKSHGSYSTQYPSGCPSPSGTQFPSGCPSPSGTPFPSGSPFPSSTPYHSGPAVADLRATEDSFLRSESPNTNEGANLRLRVGTGPVSRAVIQFDHADVLTYMQNVQRVELVLTIANNHNTWGHDHQRSVVAHALRTEFVEGNGIQALMPDSLAQRATGPGVTWHSPEDPEAANRRLDRRPRPETWNGGAYRRATAAPVPHENLQQGVVVFDVTADVIDSMASGWLLKLDHEREDQHERHALGDEPSNGVVEYHSIQGSDYLGDGTLAPYLRFYY